MGKKMGALISKTLLAFGLLFGFIIALSLITQSLFTEIDVSNLIAPIGLGLTAWLMYRLFERKKDWDAGWRDRHAVTNSFMGILIIAIVFAVTMSMLLLTGNVILQEYSWRWGEMINQVFLFLLIALGEEWLFRGYLYGLYKSMTGVKMAIVLNSCLFAAIHLLNPHSLSKPLEHIILEMVNIFLLSVIMSLAREYSGSLWMPIGIHFAMNFLQSSIFGFLNGGKQVDSLFYFEYVNKTLWNGAGYGLESSMVFTPVLIFSVLLMYFIFQKKSLGPTKLH